MASRPTTAPEGRAKSKFVANRTNAIKEIEAWVTEGDGYRHRDATRMSGQLTDNITEERMLKAKLWELSRERYKFLSQSEYEKKIFLERIQRKSSSQRRHPGQEERTPPLLGKRRKIKSSNARLALLDRFDPTKARDRPKEFRDGQDRKDPTKDRIKYVRFGSDDVSHNPKVPPKEALCAQNLARLDFVQRSQSASHIRTLPELAERKVPPKQEDIQRMFSIKDASLQPVGSIRPWAASRRSKSGSMVSSSSSLNSLRYCTDPRILNLENCLAPLHRVDSSVDVSTVVQQIESLHLPPKVNKETRKPKTALIILEHMRARGLVI